jgi:hypothetical protein
MYRLIQKQWIREKSGGNGQKQKGAIERQRDNGEKLKGNKKAPRKGGPVTIALMGL